MFKLVENPNAQKIAGVVLLSLPIYIMVSFIYDAFKKQEGFDNEDPAAKMQELNDQILSDI